MPVPHLTFDANTRGRDIVVGDVHGCFRTLERALAHLEFNTRRDRLFGVGDLVARGPHSREAAHWIEKRFTAVALGNHDRAALRSIESRLRGSNTRASGWLRSLAPSEFPRWRDAFERMPLAITIATAHGAIGVVHAESPHHLWSEALRLLESGHDLDIDNTLLGLDEPVETIRRHRSEPVQGLHALVVGHEPVIDIERTANRWNVDTGAGIARFNRLSLLSVNESKFRSWTFPVDEESAN